MKTIIWSSDTHLNLATEKGIKKFIDQINEKKADLLLLTGDISESPNLHEHLEMLSNKINIPICFILGNHDFYKSSIDKTLFKLSKFVENKKNLIWLTKEGVIQLNSNTCLIGSENWWDGYYGATKQTFLQDFVMRQDYKEIEDLAISKKERVAELQRLNNICLNRISKLLTEAVESYDNIFLAVHVPPFPESCAYSDFLLPEEWLFHFCCYSLGELLTKFMKNYPTKQLTVLCGHTHTAMYYKPQHNITVLTAKASYHKPKIYTTIAISK